MIDADQLPGSRGVIGHIVVEVAYGSGRYVLCSCGRTITQHDLRARSGVTMKTLRLKRSADDQMSLAFQQHRHDAPPDPAGRAGPDPTHWRNVGGRPTNAEVEARTAREAAGADPEPSTVAVESEDDVRRDPDFRDALDGLRATI